MPTIAICASMNFGRQIVDMEADLGSEGYSVFMPRTAERMKESGDYDVDHYRTWLNNAADYHRKAKLIRGHLDKIAKSDAILVLNYEKHGVANYIGGNVLIEMALAFYLHKPIFIYNDVPDESPYLEEIIGLEPMVLHGELAVLREKFPV